MTVDVVVAIVVVLFVVVVVIVAIVVVVVDVVVVVVVVVIDVVVVVVTRNKRREISAPFFYFCLLLLSNVTSEWMTMWGRFNEKTNTCKLLVLKNVFFIKSFSKLRYCFINVLIIFVMSKGHLSSFRTAFRLRRSLCSLYSIDTDFDRAWNFSEADTIAIIPLIKYSY